MMTRGDMRAVLDHVERRTHARDAFLCKDREEKGDPMNQARELDRRIALLEGATNLAVGDPAAVDPEAARRRAAGDVGPNRGRAPGRIELDRSGDLWDRINVISARVGAMHAALERFVDEHVCANPDGKGAKPCAACSLGAALTETDRSSLEVRRGDARSLVETELATAAGRLPSDTSPAELFSGEPTIETSSAKGADRGKRKG